MSDVRHDLRSAELHDAGWTRFVCQETHDPRRRDSKRSPREIPSPRHSMLAAAAERSLGEERYPHRPYWENSVRRRLATPRGSYIDTPPSSTLPESALQHDRRPLPPRHIHRHQRHPSLPLSTPRPNPRIVVVLPAPVAAPLASPPSDPFPPENRPMLKSATLAPHANLNVSTRQIGTTYIPIQ